MQVPMNKTIVKKYLVRGQGAHPDEIGYAGPGTKLLLETTYMREASDVAPNARDANFHDRAVVYEYFGEDGSEQTHSQVTALFDTAVVRYLEGKLLTHIEATFTDHEQREAHKSLVRNLLWDTYNRFERDARDVAEHAEVVEPKTLSK